MAISNLGVLNNLPLSQKPTGYVDPVVASFTDWEYTRTLRLTVPKATVENGTAATTMANIIANGTVGLNKQIADIISADYLTTPAVTTYGIWTGLSTNMVVDPSNTYLTNAATAYVCDVVIYIKAI